MTGLKTRGTNRLDEGWRQHPAALHKTNQISKIKGAPRCLCSNAQTFCAPFFKATQGQQRTASIFLRFFSKAPEPEGGDRMFAGSRLRSFTCGSNKMTALDKTKQRAADVNCIRTCPPFTSKLLVLPPPNVRRRALQWKRRGKQSLGAITLRGDQLTGRFCVLTLMECKQRWVLQRWRRSTRNNEENNRGTGHKKIKIPRHLEYLQHELISAWHCWGYSKVPSCTVSKGSAKNNTVCIHLLIVSTTYCVKSIAICKYCL